MSALESRAGRQVALQTNRAALQYHGLGFVLLHLLNAGTERVLELSGALYHLAPAPRVHRELVVGPDAPSVVGEVLLDQAGAQDNGAEHSGVPGRVVTQ